MERERRIKNITTNGIIVDDNLDRMIQEKEIAL